MYRWLMLAAAIFAAETLLVAQAAPKKILAWGDTTTAYQHDSISHALATIERLGRESGAFETYIRTDSQWVIKHPLAEGVRNDRNLDYFDAIVFMGTGDNLDAQ